MDVTFTLSIDPGLAAEAATHPSAQSLVQPALDASPSGPPLPLPITTIQLTARTGEIMIVTGPNGVGKSALLSEIARELAGQNAEVETFFGSRHIQFQSEDIDQIGQSLDQLQARFRQNVTRFRHPWGEEHLKSVVRRVQNSQSQSAFDIIIAQEAGTDFRGALMKYPQVLKATNKVFAAARLPIRIVMADGILRAHRDGIQYGIDRLSDGERAALLVVCAVLIQPPDAFIVIDEPERHLNPAISGALLAALVRTRKDLGFVFATHDLNLIEWLDPHQVIHLRGSNVIRRDPEQRRFELTMLSPQHGIPEELRFAILGSRRLLLLVEGEATSEDKALYGHIYRDWNVVARGGWETVTSGVKALARNRHYHWLRVAGIIDRDGRNDEEVSTLAAAGIFCLPLPTIENLFLDLEVIRQMASQIHALKGGESGAARVDAVNHELMKFLPAYREEVVVQRLVWEGNRRLSDQKLSSKAIRQGQGQRQIAAIDLHPIQERLESEFDDIVRSSEPVSVLKDLPVKNSGIPSKVAETLGYENFRDYTRSVLQQIEIGSDAGSVILSKLRTIMPVLRDDT